MERFDVIVVGAGPAGSTTAYRLARGGARVVLLDRARFPRDKPCGGGLTYRAVRQMPVAPDPVVEHVVDRFSLRFRYRGGFERQSEQPLVLMTQRKRLDAFLAEGAADAGAQFRDGTKVDAFEQNGHVTVRAGGERIQADVLIGADGVNGIVARTLGLDQTRRFGVALEGNVAYTDELWNRFSGRAFVEMGSLTGGYGWVFPKGDHVNVGVGGWEVEATKLRLLLQRLCAAHGIREEAVEDLRGFRLPMRLPGSRFARGRTLLVGDAAALVDPLSGDGMYEAFVSGRLAAEATLGLLGGRESDLEHYPTALEAELARTLAASWKVKRAFDRFPRTTFSVARLPVVWTVFAAFVRGDLHEPGDARGVVRAPLRLVDALSRLS
ncbi:MAG: geranylgeranyl reductase family protein [Actinomycetota bacterium]|nr:geranylgeranyl reductase family protein [Actinomycetota bacterium]